VEDNVAISISASHNLVSKRTGRLIGLARVSTDEQNLALQRDALLKAGCDLIFEECISGAAANRPELEKCLAELSKGDVLVVWKLDRLGRSLIDLLQIVRDLEHRGVQFQSLSDSIDTTTPAGALFFAISGAFAEYERSQIKERVKAGIAAARSRGAHLGRRRALSSSAMDHAQRLIADGESVRSVARSLKCSVATLYRRLAEIRPLEVPGVNVS
jgi:DNA invertase Pin-like site-specific DNA recombinase